MNNYNTIIEEANSYAGTIAKSFEKKKFDNKFLLNLATMSMEKFMVAYLMMKDELPNHHSLGFLAGEMTRYIQLPVADIDILEQLDEKIQLCSLDAAPEYIPTDYEMKEIINVLTHLQYIVKNELVN